MRRVIFPQTDEEIEQFNIVRAYDDAVDFARWLRETRNVATLVMGSEENNGFAVEVRYTH